jgi:hypothetical protein
VLFVFLADATLFVKSEIFAQELTLFEEVEAPRGGDGSRGGALNSSGDIASDPIFTLVGTARFGNHYSAVINNGSESNIRIEENPGSLIFIPGHPGYELIKVSSGEISIRYPTKRSCVSIKDKGISCSEANVATLRLSNAEPIKSAIPDLTQGVEQNISENPFAALLEEASTSNSGSEETTSFTPRRISPEDVPSGMRVVSTPFGDRLVEE